MKNCPRCHTVNEDNAAFCRNCGLNMAYAPTGQPMPPEGYGWNPPGAFHQQRSYRDVLLIIAAAIVIARGLFYYIISVGSYEILYKFRYLRTLIEFAALALPLLLAFAIKNKTAKIIFIVLASILTLFDGWELLKEYMRHSIY